MFDNLNGIDNMYKDYKIYKGNGKFRKISAPSDELKAEQRRILYEELTKIKVSNRAFGFVGDRSIYDNAKEHIGADCILTMDLKDFFDTITYQHVLLALTRNGIPNNKAQYIAKVCTRFGTTPQGAPTSPALSNIVCKPMDRKIGILCKTYDCKYTRYADDITISGDYYTLQTIKASVASIVNGSGFKINGSKTHTIGRHRAQDVTGLTINNIDATDIGLSASAKKEVRTFRAKLHNIRKEIEAKTLNSFEELKERYDSINSMQGYANFIYQADANMKKYVDQVAEIRTLLKERESYGATI